MSKFLATKNIAAVILAAAMIIGFAFAFARPAQQAEASGYPGSLVRVATTSISAIAAAGVNTLIATTSCTSRIISTTGSPIMLTFSDYANQAPTGLFGFLQPASTTVAYDSGIYGCGKVKAYSFTAATITIADTQ